MDDALTLPGLGGPTSVTAEESGYRIVTDPLSLESSDFLGEHRPPLADQREVPANPDDLAHPVDFPLELRATPEKPDLLSSSQANIPAQSNSSEELHSMKAQAGSGAVTPGAEFSGDQNAHQNARFGGSNRAWLSAAGKKMHDGSDSGFGKGVKVKFAKSGRTGTVLVHFWLNNSHDGEAGNETFDDENVDPKLIAKARAFVRAVRESSVSSSQENPDTEQGHENGAGPGSWQDDVMRFLRLYPGGLEIIAEMTPAQLRALANKLDARSSKLRALMN